MLDSDTIGFLTSEAKRLRVDLAALLAVVEVESAGKPFAIVEGEKQPLIRWEGHYFDRRLAGPSREAARAAKLAHPRAGKIKNPRGMERRYALLARAVNHDAVAWECISVGVGQVMGAHWRKLGYQSARALWESAATLQGQIELMIRYIEAFGLVDELRRKDWTGFARGYNGPAHAKHNYSGKLTAAYRRHSDTPTGVSGMLRMGATGARVREMQTLLRRAGHPLNVDGDYGPATKTALRAFQQSKGLTLDGVAGPETWSELDEYRQEPGEQPGHVKPMETKEVGRAAKGVGVVAILTALRDEFEALAARMSGVDIGFADDLSSYLTLGAGLLTASLVAYGAWGVFAARRTDEGGEHATATAQMEGPF